MDLERKEILRLAMLLIINISGLVVAQLDNYYNWPESEPPVVKTEVHTAGRETRVRCQLRDRFRHVQNSLNLTWEHKPCSAGHSLGCLKGGLWTPLCGAPRAPCPPVLSLVEPRAQDSGLYRCHITLDSVVVPVNVFMLQFVENRREPPVIMDDTWTNVSVVAPKAAALQCKVRSPVPPTLRWFRRLDPALSPQVMNPNYIQYLNSTYQLLNCCSIAVQSSHKDIYLSKLVISPSSVPDSGYYICLAINDANFTFKEAYINVMPPIISSGTPEDTDSFLGLFLIPAMFATIPAIVWMMCLRSPKPKSEKRSSPLLVQAQLMDSTTKQPKRLTSDISQP